MEWNKLQLITIAVYIYIYNIQYSSVFIHICQIWRWECWDRTGTTPQLAVTSAQPLRSSATQSPGTRHLVAGSWASELAAGGPTRRRCLPSSHVWEKSSPCSPRTGTLNNAGVWGQSFSSGIILMLEPSWWLLSSYQPVKLSLWLLRFISLTGPASLPCFMFLDLGALFFVPSFVLATFRRPVVLPLQQAPFLLVCPTQTRWLTVMQAFSVLAVGIA